MIASFKNRTIVFLAILTTLTFSSVSSINAQEAKTVNASKTERIFEMRTYYAEPGKMDALHARFRDHTCKLFEKHGITIIGFWKPTDGLHPCLPKQRSCWRLLESLPSWSCLEFRKRCFWKKREACQKSWIGFLKPYWLFSNQVIGRK